MQKTLEEFIRTLDSSFKNILAEVGSSLNFTASQAAYIEAIYRLHHPTLSELADALGISKASVTAAINKLLRQGYVVKTPSMEDKRVSHLNLTPTGEELIEAKQQALTNYTEFIRDALSQEEAQQLEHIMAKLVQRFRN